VSQEVWHDKDPSLLKDAEHSLKFYSPSPAIVSIVYNYIREKFFEQRDVIHKK
jgi:hypothetical protein